MDLQRWTWRLRATNAAPDAQSPPASQIWVGANASPPSPAHPYNVLTGAVLIHPSLTVSKIRVRLLQEVAVRRDAARRRARSLPCRSPASVQWAGTLNLGTGVHKGGVVADTAIVDVAAVPSLHVDDTGARQWMFAARLPEDLPRSWTWAACEGDRKKIWFLDMRYRVVAEAFSKDGLLGSVKNFVSFSPNPQSYPTQDSRRLQRPRRVARLPSCTSGEFDDSDKLLWRERDPCEDAPPASSSSSQVANSPMGLSDGPRASSSSNASQRQASGSSRDEPTLSSRIDAFGCRRRTAMVFDRHTQPDERPNRLPRRPDSTAASRWTRSISVLGTLSEKRKALQAETFAIRQKSPAHESGHLPANRSWRVSKVTTTEDFEDVTVVTNVHIPTPPATPHTHAQINLGERVAATIKLVPKTALSQLTLTAVLAEVIEIVDDFGTQQVHLQHHYRMAATDIPVCVARRQAITCTAEMTAADKLFSADAVYDFTRVSHRLDISINYERRRVFGGLLFGEVAPAEHDLWDVVDGDGLKVLASVPICLREGSKPEQEMKGPCLAIWGSTESIAAVGTSECRTRRRAPTWAAIEAGQSETRSRESKIDALRSLAYAKSRARRREESPDGRSDAELRRFPTFVVEKEGALAKQNCPVCLEKLNGIVMMLPCLHAGHRSCFGRSQSRAAQCPVCRLDLSPYAAAQSSEGSTE